MTINNHLGVETATEKGWMTQVRQGAHTTRSSVTALDETNDECTAIPQQDPGNSKTTKYISLPPTPATVSSTVTKPVASRAPLTDPTSTWPYFTSTM